MIMLNHSLRIFLCVAEKESVTEAARELYISQPAVSKAIKNVEDELGVRLFYRNRRKGLILTDVGREILSLARQMADMENRMYQAAFRSNNCMSGTVRIASMPILTSVILSRAFRTFKTRYPHVAIELIEGSSTEIRAAIEDRRVDMALVSGPFGPLDHETLFQDRMVAVSREPLADESSVDVNVHPERYIYCRAGQETVLELLRSHNVNMAESLVVEQAETVIRLAEAQNGIGIVSKLVLDYTEHDLIPYPVTPDLRIDVGLAALDLQDMTPVARALKDIIVDVVRDLGL